MFVVFEGLDGSGKSTLMKGFSRELTKRGVSHITTYDPGDTEVGKQIRSILLSGKNRITKQTELFLYEASRAELVDKKIAPALKQNNWVLSDRYFMSTVAYQGYARGLDLNQINLLNDIATAGLKPDIVVWVNTDVKECQRRLNKRLKEGEKLSHLDLEKEDFHKKVFEGYRKQMQDPKGVKWLEIQGELLPEQMLKELLKKMGEFLK